MGLAGPVTQGLRLGAGPGGPHSEPTPPRRVASLRLSGAAQARAASAAGSLPVGGPRPRAAARGRHGATIMAKHIEPTAANHGTSTTSIFMIAQEPAVDPRLVRSTAAA